MKKPGNWPHSHSPHLSISGKAQGYYLSGVPRLLLGDTIVTFNKSSCCPAHDKHHNCWVIMHMMQRPIPVSEEPPRIRRT